MRHACEKFEIRNVCRFVHARLSRADRSGISSNYVSEWIVCSVFVCRIGHSSAISFALQLSNTARHLNYGILECRLFAACADQLAFYNVRIILKRMYVTDTLRAFTKYPILRFGIPISIDALNPFLPANAVLIEIEVRENCFCCHILICLWLDAFK